MRRIQCLSLLLVAAGGAFLLAERAGYALGAQGGGNPRPAAQPFTLRLVFGLKDAEPAVWEGSARATNGTIRRVEGWRFSGNEAVGAEAGRAAGGARCCGPSVARQG